MTRSRTALVCALALALTLCGDLAATDFIRGDANASGRVDISDVIAALEFLFLGGAEPPCIDAADSDDSGVLDISDGVNIVSVLFLGTGGIPAPGPTACGPDPTDDPLDCAAFAPCPQGPPAPRIEGFAFVGVNVEGYPEYRHVGTKQFVGTGMVFVLLEGDGPGGEMTFEMGSPDTECVRDTDEGPVHPVRLSPYLIAKHECTQRVWEAVMGSNPSFFRVGGPGQSSLPPELRENEAWLELPVEQVSWLDIQLFEECTGLGLPSEAQWEHACRGGTTTPFAFGETLDSVTQANYYGLFVSCGYQRGSQYLGHTTPVGSYAANPFGLHDVHGNIWEWCEDEYDGGFYARAEAAGPDPVLSGAPGAPRVIRGGVWSGIAQDCRAANRDWRGPSSRHSDDFGFRPARVLRGGN